MFPSALTHTMNCSTQGLPICFMAHLILMGLLWGRIYGAPGRNKIENFRSLCSHSVAPCPFRVLVKGAAERSGFQALWSNCVPFTALTWEGWVALQIHPSDSAVLCRENSSTCLPNTIKLIFLINCFSELKCSDLNFISCRNCHIFKLFQAVWLY